MTTLTRVCRFLPPEFPEDTAALLRLLAALREPESVEGWQAEPDGSDTSMASQLEDSGYGSQGVF